MSIRTKLVAAFLAFGLLASAMAAYAVRQAVTLGGLAIQVYDGPLMGISYARAAQSGFNSLLVQAGTAGVRMEGILAAEKEIAGDFAIVRERLTDPKSVEALNRASDALTAWRQMKADLLSTAPRRSIPAPWLLDEKARAAIAALDDLVEIAAAYGYEFRTAAEAQVNETRIKLIATAAAIAALGLVLGLLFARSLGGPILLMRDAIGALLKGERVEVPGRGRKDELGELARAMASVHEAGAEGARFRAALDSSSTCILTVGENLRVQFANRNALSWLARHAGTPAGMGRSIVGLGVTEVFPGAAGEVLLARRDGQSQTVTIGARTVAASSNEVRNEAGDMLGYAVELRDVTDEVFHGEIERMVAAAAQGDFTVRAPVEGRTGFTLTISSGLNAIASSVETAVGEFVAVMEGIADGDLTRRASTRYEGLFGSLQAAVETTAERLSDSVTTIKSAATDIAEAAREISQGAGDLSNRTEEQANALVQTASAAGQITTLVRTAAGSSAQASATAESARAAAQQGGAVITDAIAAMGRIEDAARKINEITTVIDDIAFQTNLLALNAAVEAARAGEAGKGFAVVASEVRTLAQRSSEAAKDISGLLNASNAQVTEGVQLVRRAGDVLGDIVRSSEKVASSVAEISMGTQEQARSIEQVSQSMDEVDRMTQQNAALAEESAAASQALQSRIGELNDFVAGFRTRESAAAHTPAAARGLRRRAA